MNSIYTYISLSKLELMKNERSGLKTTSMGEK